MDPGDLVLLNPAAAGLAPEDPNGRVLGMVLETSASRVTWYDDVHVLWSDGAQCWHTAGGLILVDSRDGSPCKGVPGSDRVDP